MASENKGKIVAFWILTGLVVLSQGASGVGDLMKAPAIVEGVTALGYPEYILTILGPAKLIGVAVLAAPGLLRLKEWAYAGFTIDFLGAFASHLFAGDPIANAAPAFVLLVVVLGSYFLRPESRRL